MFKEIIANKFCHYKSGIPGMSRLNTLLALSEDGAICHVRNRGLYGIRITRNENIVYDTLNTSAQNETRFSDNCTLEKNDTITIKGS